MNSTAFEVSIWNRYIDHASKAVYMYMDKKITDDITSHINLPDVIISPYQTVPRQKERHPAVHIRRLTLQRFLARDTYEEAYWSCVKNPYQCSKIQEAYFAMFTGVFMLFRGGSTLDTNYGKHNSLQHKVLTFSAHAREALNSEIAIQFGESMNPSLLCHALKNKESRRLSEYILVNSLDRLLTPLYTEGTFGQSRSVVPELSEQITANALFGTITL